MEAASRIGQIINGKYIVEGVLGEGGMGVVVAARHLALNQRFAIKLLRPAMLLHREIAERFAREARTAARIQSDHVARVIDVDVLATGEPFIVMELLDGNDLSTVRSTQRPLSPHLAVSYLLEACDGLAEAHRVGIIHRDLKPSNLFLVRRPNGSTRVKVLDFGISKYRDPAEGAGQITATSMLLGSAEYMSPEQMISSRDVDVRSDIWSLGVTLYELLTARVPYPADSIVQAYASINSSAPTPPSQYVAVEPGLESVVLRCLERNPAYRYASVAELAAALGPYSVARETRVFGTPNHDRESRLDAVSSGSPSNASNRVSGSAPGTMVALSSGSLITPAPKSRLGFVVGAALIAIAVAGGTVGLRAQSKSGMNSTSAVSAASVAPQSTESAIELIDAPAPSPVVSPVEVETLPPSTVESAMPPTPPPKHESRPGVRASQVLPKVNCTPPFTVDSNGVKHAKPECT